MGGSSEAGARRRGVQGGHEGLCQGGMGATCENATSNQVALPKCSHLGWSRMSVRIGVSQTCLGANVLSGLVPSTVFKKNLWALLGPCVRGRGRAWYGTSAQPESHFTCSHQEVPLGWYRVRLF